MFPTSISRLDVMQHTSPIPRMHSQNGSKELWLFHWWGCLSTMLLNKNHSPNTPGHSPWLRAGQKDWHHCRGVKDLTNMRTAESSLTRFSFKPWSLWPVFSSLTSALALTSDSLAPEAKSFALLLNAIKGWATGPVSQITSPADKERASCSTVIPFIVCDTLYRSQRKMI